MKNNRVIGTSQKNYEQILLVRFFIAACIIIVIIVGLFIIL